jgi:SHS2 domain-containing protein
MLARGANLAVGPRLHSLSRATVFPYDRTMYETFDHTADVGMRVSAPDLPGLFAEAAKGLLSLLVEDVDSVAATDEKVIRLEEPSLEYLLFDWLRELLYLYDAHHFLVCACKVSIETGILQAKIYGESCDPVRHCLAHEVKAITSHGLVVREESDGYRAEYIVDI